jgi:hypothetical protein
MKMEIENMVFFFFQICGFKNLEIFFKILAIAFKFTKKWKIAQKFKMYYCHSAKFHLKEKPLIERAIEVLTKTTLRIIWIFEYSLSQNN